MQKLRAVRDSHQWRQYSPPVSQASYREECIINVIYVFFIYCETQQQE